MQITIKQSFGGFGGNHDVEVSAWATGKEDNPALIKAMVGGAVAFELPLHIALELAKSIDTVAQAMKTHRLVP